MFKVLFWRKCDVQRGGCGKINKWYCHHHVQIIWDSSCRKSYAMQTQGPEWSFGYFFTQYCVFPNYEDIKCVSVTVWRQPRKRGFHYVTYYAHISMQFLDFDEVVVKLIALSTTQKCCDLWPFSCICLGLGKPCRSSFCACFYQCRAVPHAGGFLSLLLLAFRRRVGNGAIARHSSRCNLNAWND